MQRIVPCRWFNDNVEGRNAMKNKVVMFEIPASNLQKAKAFYESVFDWTIEIWDDRGAMVQTTASDNEYNPTEPGGINGGIYTRKSSDEHASFGVETESIDRTLKAIEKAGGKVVTPKHSIGEWGFMADFADPEGNVIALWERPKN
jgi:predicted enzyme related to lactoylglutathione lyase